MRQVNPRTLEQKHRQSPRVLSPWTPGIWLVVVDRGQMVSSSQLKDPLGVSRAERVREVLKGGSGCDKVRILVESVGVGGPRSEGLSTNR